jgi:hypothetical protein
VSITTTVSFPLTSAATITVSFTRPATSTLTGDHAPPHDLVIQFSADHLLAVS